MVLVLASGVSILCMTCMPVLTCSQNILLHIWLLHKLRRHAFLPYTCVSYFAQVLAIDMSLGKVQHLKLEDAYA
jgi:hypothetical protein